METKYAFDCYVDGEYEQYGPFYGKYDLKAGILKFYKGFCVPREGLDELTLKELVKVVNGFLYEPIYIFECK
nr:MAG TPA: hypothetical protein [Caudoviricetes sp.]